MGRVLDDGSTQLYTYQYNDLGKKTKDIDPLGRTRTYVYDANGIDLLEVRMTRNGANELLQHTTYNSRHFPLTTTDAAGQTTTFGYNSRGQLLTVTNALGQTTTYVYDAKGYPTSVDGPLPGTQDRETLTYDAVGRLRSRTDGSGYAVTLDYDALNHITQATFPDGTTQLFGYDLLDPTLLVDRAGRTTMREFSSVRKLAKVTDPLGRVTQFDWCKCGEISSLTDALGRTTSWQHDVQSRPIGKTFPDGSRIQYFYEKTTSRLQRQIDEKGQETRYAWNADGALASVTYPNAEVPTPGLSYTYDPDYPRIASLTDGTGTTVYGYFPVTNPTALGASLLAAQDGPLPDDTIAYRYDELGREVSVAIGGHEETTTYDVAGRVAEVTNALGTFLYAYEGGTARRTLLTYPNGLTAQSAYADNLGDNQLQKITHKVGATPVSEFAYTYDAPLNRLATFSRQDGTQTPLLHAYRYDEADQVTGATLTQGGAATGSYAYTYDAAANRLTAQAGSTLCTYAYNALNELTSLNGSASPSTYRWTAENSLAELDSGSTSTLLAYDGLDRCVEIRQLTNGTETSRRRLLWLGDGVREERDAAGAVTKRYFQQGVKIETGPNAGAYYYTRDHLGSIRELVDGSARSPPGWPRRAPIT